MSQASRPPEGSAPTGADPSIVSRPGPGPTAPEGGNGPGGVAIRSAIRSRTWVGIAANRGAGQGRGRRKVARLVRALRAHGVRSRVAWTLDGRARLVADAAEDHRARGLVAVGGDGTVAGLINERPSVPITVLPTGTENLFARHFGLAADPDRIAETVLNGQARPIDLGCFNGHRFSLMAGIGFDADVVTRHHVARVRRTGLPSPTHRAAYVEPILRASLDYRFPMMDVRILDPGAEEVVAGSTVFLFNLPRYALGLPFAPSAEDDDGWLDLVVFQQPGPFRALHYLWLVLRGLHLRRRGVVHRRVRRVEIAAADRIPVQLDGDPGGWIGPDDGPGVVEVLPRAIEVLVPTRI